MPLPEATTCEPKVHKRFGLHEYYVITLISSII